MKILPLLILVAISYIFFPQYAVLFLWILFLSPIGPILFAVYLPRKNKVFIGSESPLLRVHVLFVFLFLSFVFLPVYWMEGVDAGDRSGAGFAVIGSFFVGMPILITTWVMTYKSVKDRIKDKELVSHIHSPDSSQQTNH